MVVMSKRRFRIYGGWLLATVGLIVAACFAVNCLVDPLWYLRGERPDRDQLPVQRTTG